MIVISALLVVIITLIAVLAGGAASRRKRQLQIQSLATGIESLRRAATREMRRRSPGPADALTGEQLTLYESSAREMRDAGLTVLGDLIEEMDDGSPYGTSRWFVDAGGTICGWYAAVPVKGSPGKFRTLMLFFSEADAGQFMTTSRGAPELGLARPPTTHRQFVPWGEGVARALERHRSLIESVAGKGAAMRTVATLDDAVALLLRHRTHIASWRQGQPADALLEADARNVLRERYAEIGPVLLDYMRRT
ncbi:MAG TPA: hypothetical protein VGY57_13365 [Vicinamibacterales bacterium]|nr:hypothetical protein [Vicinamibacterales bacterium]